ncbi:MAG: N4-gp56 family major capsid protein [Oscillospiraceae bacterium]|nr:N4-gp56 family major capsid protein [Oscillospiraceae bacterium]
MTKTNKIFVGLQFFADAGSLINTSENYANAYDASQGQAFSPTETLSPTMKTFYDTALLENARAKLYYAQFAKKQPLPRNHGKNVEWRKFKTFEKAGKLVEGVIPNAQKMSLVTITGSIDQFGTFTAISDQLELRAYDPVIMVASEEMGASGAETQEELIRDALYAGTNVLYCNRETIANGAQTPVTGETGLVDNSTYRCWLTPKMINRAVTIMKKNKVPTINGKYYAVIHPSVAEDLRNSDGWLEAHKYAAPEEIFNGEIGELHGVRFIESPNAPVFKGKPLHSAGRTLAINYGSGYSGAITSVAFDGGTVGNNDLKDRFISINGIVVKVASNTASAITFASTNFGTITDNTVIYPAEYGADDIAAYATYFFGKDSFGIIDPEAGGMEMIVKSRKEVGGPLEQWGTVGYKFETNGATILYQERLLRVMSTSSYSGTDTDNRL